MALGIRFRFSGDSKATADSSSGNTPDNNSDIHHNQSENANDDIMEESESTLPVEGRVRNDWQLSQAQLVSTRIIDSNRTGGSSDRAGFASLAVMSSHSGDSLAFNDSNNNKTLARRIAEYLMDYSWYNPNRHNKEIDLREGWAFFEHVTLARRLTNTEKGEKIRRAIPGERIKETKLYSFWKTTADALNDWGIGVALYFATLKAIASCFLFAGLVSLPNMLFFSSGRYSGDYPKHQRDLYLLRGTAMCEGTEYAVCEDGWCDPDTLESKDINYWQDGDGLTFIQRSVCGSNDDGDSGITFMAGMVNYISVMILALFSIAFAFYQRNRAITFDEDKITASDYSVMVHNPPPDAKDPEEWRDFFEQFTADDVKGVTCCTILVNNSLLLRKLLARRYFRTELQKWLPNTNLDDTSAVEKELPRLQEEIRTRDRSLIGRIFDVIVKPIVKPFNKFLYPDVLYEKLNTTIGEIKELQQQHYDVSDVIVTFETEADQRTALNALKASKLDVRTQRAGNRESELFRGKHVLDIDEPVEPSAIRFLDLDTGWMRKVILEVSFFTVTVGLIILSGVLVYNARKELGPQYAGFLTSSLNLVIPLLVKVMLIFERHDTEGSRQRSLFTKVALFRWTVTAIMPLFVTPFSRTLASGKQDLMFTVRGILISEMFLVPVLRLLDIGGVLSKHVFAPRARTRYQMFLCFRGTPYDLAERYTDVTKIVLLCVLYCALFPQILIYGALILAVRYYADKFALLRIWQPAPYIGTQLAKVSMRIYFSLAIVMSFVTSAYFFAFFPFDQVCKGETDVEVGLYKDVKLRGEGEAFEISIKDDSSVRVCNESSCCQQHTGRFSFNALLKRLMPVPGRLENEGLEWMSDGQENLSKVYGYTAFVMVIIWLTVMIVKPAITYFHSLYTGVYTPEGQDQEVDFSSAKDMIAYIPRIYFGNHTYPIIACDIDNVDNSLIGWNDPDMDYDYYNLTLDMPLPGVRKSKVVELLVEEKVEDIDENEEAMVEVSIRDAEADNEETDNTKESAPGMIFSTVTHWPPEYARKTS